MRGFSHGRRFDFPIDPMTLGNMRELGLGSLDVSCWNCHHQAPRRAAEAIPFATQHRLIKLSQFDFRPISSALITTSNAVEKRDMHGAWNFANCDK
jgi:hypothetical protein